MAATGKSGRRTPVWWTAFCGVLGAGGGLLVAALWIRAGTWVTDRSSGLEGPALLGVAIFMAGIVCMLVVAGLGLPWPYAVATGLLHTLLVLPLAFHGDAVLDRRGERVAAAVSDVRTTEGPNTGRTGHHCRVRLPDGTETEVTGPGCDGDTRTGDRLTVYRDPLGRVPAKLEVQVTDEQRTWVARAGAAGFLLVGARIGVHVARHGTAEEAP
ncbi:hypothetical protein [Streptomyces phytophilus]|uniref:hypothetical protein n=1 Tax=Streptomyces phytophilus TaxID=722715 RepID=UPI0015F0D843|nr:hypothetical protein [Streptomyces phytophilus]